MESIWFTNGANRNGMFLCFPDPHLVKCDHSHCWKLSVLSVLAVLASSSKRLCHCSPHYHPPPPPHHHHHHHQFNSTRTKTFLLFRSYDPLIISPHLLQLTEDGVVLEEHALATQQVSSALAIVHIPYKPQKL